MDRKFLFYYTDIQIYIGVSNFDGSDLTKGWIANAGINELHLLFVEISNLTGKTQEDFKTSLKNEGVDTKNYDEMIKYFGLD